MKTGTEQEDFRIFEQVELCPVCESSSGRDYFPDIRQCLDCRVYFHSRRPSWEEIRNFYDSGRTYASWAKERGMRDRLWAKRLALIQKRMPTGRLLDVGTGDGHFLQVAVGAGYNAEGTEISRSGVQLCHIRRARVFHGMPEDLPADQTQYDVVTLWHVLEHSMTPGKLLDWIFSRLRPGGLLAVAVPNATTAALRTRLRGNKRHHRFEQIKWGGEIHLTHFVPATIRRALRRSGFEKVETLVDDVYVHRGRSEMADYSRGRVFCLLTGGIWFPSRALLCLAVKP